MKRILISALFLLFLFVSVPAWATIWMSTGGAGDIYTSGADGDSTTTSSDSGLEVIGGTITLLRGCDNGEIPKWNETTDVWECGADSTGSGSLGSELASTTNDITTSNAGDVLVLAGAGESLSLDFTTGTLNQVNVTSTTAVDDINFGAIGLTSTGGFVGDLTGNADTATALAGDPLNCDATQAAGGITAAGVAEACIDLAATYQPLDAELTTLAGLTEAQGSIIIGDATPAWSALAIGGANAVLLSNATTAAWDATPAINCADCTGIVTAGITDGTIIEPDLNVDGVPPTDGDILTYDSTGTNFAWITPHADTNITADLEEETHAADHAVSGPDTTFPADPAQDGILLWDDVPGTLEWAVIGTGLSYDGTTLTASATATKWNDIVNPTANDTISFGELSAALAWNTTTDIALDAFTIAFTNDIAETSAQRALVVSRPASAGTAVLEALVAIDNASVGGAVTDGLIITSSGAGGVVDAIDVSGADITNAINIGAHPIVTTSNTISVAELILLDTMTAKTGADLSFVTGTAGATDTCAKWNVDGDLVDTGAACGGNTIFSDLVDATTAKTLSFDNDETVTWSSAEDTGTFMTINLTDAALLGATTALLITTVGDDDAFYIPLLIQDDSGVTPDDLFKVDYQGNVTALGTLTTGGFTLVTADAGANAFFGWDDVAGQYENLSAAEALTIIGGAANDFDANGDVTITVADVSDIAANYQPLDADLTTIAGLTATNGNVMFAAASAWTSDATPTIDCTDCTANLEAADNNTTQLATTSFVQQEINGAGGTNLACSGGQCNVEAVFLLLDGSTPLTGELVADDLGIEFTSGDTLTDCTTFASGAGIYYDLSETKFKKCENSLLTDLDAAGSFNALTAPTAATSLTFQDTETITFTSEEDGGTFFRITLSDADMIGGETVALLIDSAGNNLTNFVPLLIQDNSAGVAEDLLSLNYQGNLTIAGNLSTPDTDNGKVTFTPATVGESLWSVGPNHDGIGDDNDPFEIRQSATPGTSVRASLSTAGILSVNGLLDLADDGMTISSASSTVTVESVVFTGGALGGVDSIDATGAVDMDYGSADVTDHTFTSDGGTVILDGVITADGLTLGANENITLGAETLDHDGTTFVFSDSVTVGVGGAGVDYTLTFDGETNNGVITYMEDENEFRIPHPIVAPNSWGVDITGAVTLGDSPEEVHGRYYQFTAAATATLVAAATAQYGATACFMVRDAAEPAIIDVQAGEYVQLDGTALAVGVGITATGVGEKVCMVASTDADKAGTDGWIAWGNTSGWASQ